MKKIIILSLVIVGISVALFVYIKTLGSKQEEDTNNTNINTQQESSSEDVIVTVSVPDGWIKNEDSVLEHQYQKGTASFLIKKESFASTELDTIVTSAKTIFSDTFDNVEYVGDVEDIKIDGNDAKSIVFSSSVMNLEMKYKYVYTIVNNTVYAITFGDLSSSFDSNSADYTIILESIKFE